MNNKLSNPSFGSVHFSRIQRYTDSNQIIRDTANIINDGKDQVYYNGDKVFNSPIAQEMTEKNAQDEKYFCSKDFCLDILTLLGEIPEKDSFLNRIFKPKKPVDVFRKLKKDFVHSYNKTLDHLEKTGVYMEFEKRDSYL